MHGSKKFEYFVSFLIQNCVINKSEHFVQSLWWKFSYRMWTNSLWFRLYILHCMINKC